MTDVLRHNMSTFCQKSHSCPTFLVHVLINIHAYNTTISATTINCCLTRQFFCSYGAHQPWQLAAARLVAPLRDAFALTSRVPLETLSAL